MLDFNNEAYKDLVDDLINDTFYNNDGSLRGKIATIRQYSEVIVRKILNISNSEKVTIGNRDIINRLKEVSDNNTLLISSLNTIKNNGNDCTHTQKIDKITEENFKECVNSLFNLYAYLFIAYFKKYEFGKNGEILSSFSILPPIIRYIALENLYNQDESNIMIIDKLVLAILKSFDKEKAIEWLNSKQSILENMNTVTKEAIQEISEKYGIEVAQKIINNAPKNMYVSCLERLIEVDNIISNNGILYNSFESAIELYKEKGYIEGEDEEIKEFNSIMEFVYLGRKAIKNNKLKELDKYTVMV